MAARIELTRKGIDPELIDRLMEEQMETEEDSEREKVRTLAWKRLRPRTSAERKRIPPHLQLSGTPRIHILRYPLRIGRIPEKPLWSMTNEFF